MGEVCSVCGGEGGGSGWICAKCRPSIYVTPQKIMGEVQRRFDEALYIVFADISAHTIMKKILKHLFEAIVAAMRDDFPLIKKGSFREYRGKFSGGTHWPSEKEIIDEVMEWFEKWLGDSTSTG